MEHTCVCFRMLFYFSPRCVNNLISWNQVIEPLFRWNDISPEKQSDWQLRVLATTREV